MTGKQRVFVDEYLRLGNATKAAINAGYSPKTAYSIGSENLKKPEIRAEIEQRLESLKMDADTVLRELSDMARSTMADFIDIDNEALDLQKAEQSGKLHLIKKFKRTETKFGVNIEIELYDKQAALVQLGRYHKLFTDVIEVDWRTKLVEAGLDASDIFEQIVQYVAAQSTGDRTVSD